MFMGLGMPIPDLSNKPGPGRPGWSAGTYDFQFEVTGAVTIKAQPAATGTFTIKWPNGTEVTTAGSDSIAAPDGTAGVVSINKTTDTTYADEFAVVGGKTNVSKVLSWGANSWSNLNSCFKDCTSLDDISKTKLIAGTSCNQKLMFNGCTSLLEADIKSWDLTAGVNWDYGGPFHELGNLQKLDMTGMSIKLAVQARNFLGSNTISSGIGTNVANGCEFLMSNIDWSTSTATQWTSFFRSARFAPTSTFANWVWPQYNINIQSWTQSVRVVGTNTTIDMSGWTTYYDNEFPRIDFSTISNNDENLKVDFSNLNVSNINDMNIAFYYSDVSQILGIETWGATAGGVNMQNAFVGNNFLKFTNSNNFSDTFIQSLTPTTMQNAFFQLGWGLTSNYGVAPNISNIDLSNCTSLQTLFQRTKFTNLPDIQSATFPSSAINMNSTFMQMQIYDSDVHFDLSNVSMKPSTAQQMFRAAWIRKITFGNNVDFSAVTSVQNMHYYMNQNNPDGTTTELIYPTNADFSSLTNSTDWFIGLNGTNSQTFNPLSTCQVDNLIRTFRATAYNNALNVNFYQSQITEAPSVVRTLEAELVANGWTIQENSTDATIPFEYPNFVEPGVATAPTNNTGGAFTGTFSSSDPTNIPVNSETGVINTTNTGNATIRYTLSDGCYTEQAILVASPFTTSWNIDSDFVNQTFNFRRATTGTTNNNTYFDYQIDWGDGSAMESFTDNTTPSHTYTSAGTYDIKVVGMIPGMTLSYTSGNQQYPRPEAEKLLEIKKWGDCKFSSFYYGFTGCKNMTITATDNPTFRQAGVSGYMNRFFSGCYKITSYDFTPWQTMFDSIRAGGMEYLCSGTAKIEYIKIPSFTMGYSNASNTSLFSNAGTQAGIEILNAGSGLSTGVLTTTDTGNFAIRVNEVDSNGSALDGRISLYNADGWAENAVFNFTGGLQVRITKAKPGCEIIMKDMTFTGEPYFRNLMTKAVIESADLSGWTIDKITSTQGWLSINNANQQDVTINMDNWTATGDGITSMSTLMANLNQYDSTVAFIGPKILKTTNWDSSVTENLTNFSRLGNTGGGKYSRIREWRGLDQIKLGKVTTFERMFEYMGFIALSSENGRNFSSTCMDNRVSTPTSINCSRFFLKMGYAVDYQNETNWQMPNLDGWNFTATNPVSFNEGFQGMGMFEDDSNSPGGVAFDLSNVDLSNINSLSLAFRYVNRYTSAAYKPAGAQTIKIDSLSSTLTSMYYASQWSTITNWDLRGSDLSGVTNMGRVFGEEISSINNFRFQFDNTVNLSAVTDATGFLNYTTRILNADDYANMLRGFAAGSQTSVRIDVNGTYFNAGLIFTDGRTPEQMTSTATANKVVDENKNFVELGVSTGDIVEARRANSSPIVLASVTAVSETELTLSDSIIIDNNYRYYNIQTSQAAKDRFKLLDTQSWLIYDKGPLIS